MDARAVLLGAGLFGIVVGATLGIVAGAAYRECVDSVFAAGGTVVCDDYRTLRLASFALVGLSTIATLIPVVSALRNEERIALVWRSR